MRSSHEKEVAAIIHNRQESLAASLREVNDLISEVNLLSEKKEQQDQSCEQNKPGKK